jgi:hypothetical protein
MRLRKALAHYRLIWLRIPQNILFRYLSKNLVHVQKRLPVRSPYLTCCLLRIQLRLDRITILLPLAIRLNAQMFLAR